MQTKCPTCGQLPRRSTEQNKLYWSILHEIADHLKPQGVSYTAETWHEYFKQRYLGAEEIALPNGKTIQRAQSTASLDKSEMVDYVTKVEMWAAQHGLYAQEAA